ncbi:MAG: hypothetical protein GXO31_02860 [Epsilonproteobacteria bacterium]|nr:hypothetical protein [Campylobacterota bacterium]
MRKIFLIVFFLFYLNADTFEVRNFKADIYSKNSQLVKIDLSMVFEGRDLKVNQDRVLDALNIVVGSFFFEDLMTSKGKEEFKSLLIKYLDKKYGVEVDEILILKLMEADNITIRNLIKELKKEGCCK